MAKINGTDLLVYADGTLIAYQKTCTVSWEQDLPDATTKDSSGWEEHLNGTRRATCDFDGLYSTTGLSAEDLITYITGRTSCVLVINGTGVPIVGEARPKNLSVNAAMEEPGSISGSFTYDGPAWMLTGDYVALATGWSSASLETFTSSGIKITSAIETSGSGVISSTPAEMDWSTGDVLKAVFFLTLNSGTLPTIKLYDTNGGGILSNAVTLVEGVNICTMTATGDGTDGNIRIQCEANVNFSTSDIYIFKT